MKNLKKILGPYVCLLLLSLLLAAPALTRRLSLEKSAHSSLILFDLREFSSLRTQSARQDFAALMEAGISSFLAPEYRAEEIKNGMLEGVEILPCAELPEAVRGQFSAGVARWWPCGVPSQNWFKRRRTMYRGVLRPRKAFCHRA